ncbi:MAG: SRPBCC family protein [Candidatus Acidiferrales bacterium]
MARLEFEQRIAATPALVAAFFVPQRMPYWYGHEMKAEFEILGGASDFAAGQKVRITGRLGAREVSLTAVVTRYEFGRALEWQFQDQYAVKGKQVWEIAAQDDATRVRMSDEYEMPGRFARIVDALLTRHAVSLRDRSWLARLAQLAERR